MSLPVPSPAMRAVEPFRRGGTAVSRARWGVATLAVAVTLVAAAIPAASTGFVAGAASGGVAEPGTQSGTWLATYEPARGQGEFRDAAPAPDGDGYLLVGTAGRTGSEGAFDGWLVRTDADGTVRWNRTLGGPDSDVLTSVVALEGGGYLVAGTRDTANRFAPGQWWVVRLDGDGAVVWETVGDRGRVDDLATAPGGDAIAVGTGPTNGRVRRLAGNGTTRWEQQYAVDSVAAIARNDTWYVVVGQSATGGADAWAARLSADGETLWGEYYATSGSSRFDTVAIDRERGWPYAAGRADTGTREQAPWMARLADDDGTMVWNRTLGDAGTRGVVYGAAAGWRGAVFASNEVPEGERERGHVTVVYPSSNLSDRQRVGTVLRTVHRLDDERALVAGADGFEGLAAVVRIDRVDPPDDGGPDDTGDGGAEGGAGDDPDGADTDGTSDDTGSDLGMGGSLLPKFDVLMKALIAVTAVAVLLALTVTGLALRDL